MSKNAKRKLARYRKSSGPSYSAGSGMNPVGLQGALNSESNSGEVMRRKSPVLHRSHHKYDESAFQTDHAMREVMHLVGR